MVFEFPDSPSPGGTPVTQTDDLPMGTYIVALLRTEHFTDAFMR